MLQNFEMKMGQVGKTFLFVTLALTLGSVSPFEEINLDAIKRLIGGTSVSGKENLFRVYVFNPENNDMCMGVFITPKFVLSVAHRMQATDRLSKVKVHLLYTEPGQESIGYWIRRIHFYRDFISAPSTNEADRYFNKQGVKNDIALFELRKPKKVVTLDLFNVNDALAPGTVASYVSYGPVRDLKADIQKLELTVISREECQKAYKGIHKLEEDQFCAISDDPKTKGWSRMDDGSALTVGNRAAGVLVGYPNIDRDKFYTEAKPIVFCSVSYHRNWINSIVPELGVSTGEVGEVAIIEDEPGKDSVLPPEPEPESESDEKSNWTIVKVLIVFLLVAVGVFLFFRFTKYLPRRNRSA